MSTEKEVRRAPEAPVREVQATDDLDRIVVYETRDKRLRIRRYFANPRLWIIEAIDRDDEEVQAILRDGIPATFRTFDEAQAWLFASVYDHLRSAVRERARRPQPVAARWRAEPMDMDVTALDRLRAAEQAATPAPWRVETTHVTGSSKVKTPVDGYCYFLPTPDAELFVAMRNHLGALLSVEEAAREVSTRMGRGGAWTPEGWEHFRTARKRLAAALAALGAEQGRPMLCAICSKPLLNDAIENEDDKWVHASCEAGAEWTKELLAEDDGRRARGEFGGLGAEQGTAEEPGMCWCPSDECEGTNPDCEETQP